MKRPSSATVALLVPLALVVLSSAACDDPPAEERRKPATEVFMKCGDGGPPAFPDHGVRVVAEGKNGRFVSECRDGHITRFQCEQELVVIGSGRTGPITGYRPTGNVIPDTALECESKSGQCYDGACFRPTRINPPDCATSPAPCTLGPLDPNMPSDPGAVCCLSGTGHAFHCSTAGTTHACRVAQATDGCERIPAADNGCYDFRL